MASTISLSDPISTLVTKTNTLISEVGQKSSLTTSDTTDLVAAINEINAKIVDIDTDAEIGAKVEAFFASNQLDVGGINADSADFDSATITTLTSTTGTITTLTSTDATIDSAQFTNLHLDGVGNIGHLKSLQIKNSSGTVVLAGYLLSTSNNAGTL